MNALERVLRTLAGKAVDRPPVALHNFLMAGSMMQLPFDRYLVSGELLAQAQINAWQVFGHDVLLVENGVTAMAEALGCEIRYCPDQPPHVSRRAIECPNDVKNLKMPDPESTFPLNALIEAVRMIKEYVGDGAFVMGRADQGPMALAAAIYGPEKLIVDVATGEHRDEMHNLIDFCIHCTIQLASALHRAGADGTCIGSYGMSMINPRVYQEFELPYCKMFVDHCHRENFPVGIHMCGKEDLILDHAVSSGADWLELAPFTSVEKIREATRNRCAVLGMIDQAELLLNGSPEEVKQECIRLIEQMEGVRFIPGPGCALPANCPVENIETMVDTVKNISAG